MPEKTLTSRSAVTKGTCVTGRSQDCSDSTVRGTEQASQDPPEDVSANSSTPECPRENVRSCVPATMSPSMKYKQTIKHLQAKVAAQRKTIKRLRRQPHQAPSSTSKALGVIRPHVTEEVLDAEHLILEACSAAPSASFLLLLPPSVHPFLLYTPRALHSSTICAPFLLYTPP
ncbi:uncharacterized protein LOC142784626 [Rhipicephalus microplus]|uniref:uncharacterized protein LOC142784626 n=1 Tax=Rhipicephalus microplus TaxID=6941 RepID=UPI003F6C2F67